MNAELQSSFEPGIRSRVPWDEYSSVPAISITRLKEIERSPKHYAYRLKNPKQSTAMRLGTAAHTAVLEPERYQQQFAIWSRRSEKTGNLCPQNGQYWDAFRAENPGKSYITEDEHELAVAIAAAVRSDPDAMPYLESGDPEVTMQWLQGGERPARARVDWLTRKGDEPCLVGLKTARDVRPFIFGSAAAKLGYAPQWAWYYAGYLAITGRKPLVREIVVESAPPYAVIVYRVPDDVLIKGEEEYGKWLALLDECARRGEWPGPGGGGEQDVTLPTWYYHVDDDLSDIGLE